MEKIEQLYRHCKPGLSLIEILIAIAIVGAMMAAIVPFLGQKKPGAERDAFAARLNSIMHYAWQQALITNKVQRIVFSFKPRTVHIERDETPGNRELLAQNLVFKKISGSLAEATWPRDLEIKQFFIEGYDEMKRFGGKEPDTSFFYLVPDGMTQQVTINGIVKSEKVRGRPREFGLVLNPYSAQFKAYDVYQV